MYVNAALKVADYSDMERVGLDETSSNTKLRIKYYYIRLDLCSLRSMAAFHTKVILMSYTQFSISTAFPKEPVPPVIKRVLFLSIISNLPKTIFVELILNV